LDAIILSLPELPVATTCESEHPFFGAFPDRSRSLALLRARKSIGGPLQPFAPARVLIGHKEKAASTGPASKDWTRYPGSIYTTTSSPVQRFAIVIVISYRKRRSSSLNTHSAVGPQCPTADRKVGCWILGKRVYAAGILKEKKNNL